MCMSSLQALIEAKIDPQYTSIFDATSGIIFLATPHKGSSAATLGSVAARIARLTMLINVNAKLIRRLESQNSYLVEKSHHFSKLCSKFEIFTFYETIKYRGIMVSACCPNYPIPVLGVDQR